MKEAMLIEPPPREEGRREGHENLELRLGMSPVNGLGLGDDEGGGTSPGFLTTQEGPVLHQSNRSGLGGAKRCFSETTTGGFVHPWSLAARQEKAALEQANQMPSSPSSTVTSITRGKHPSPPVVGWPPVRSFRRNLGVQPQSKSTMGSEENVEKVIKVVKEENMQTDLQEKSTMFVKVNMEGCTVGRKVDLKLHNGYDSLSHALQKMFRNFFSPNYLNNPKQDEQDEAISPSYILLYEDNEGDRMLVGDVPWELFINSVKRLYITLDPRAHKCG